MNDLLSVSSNLPLPDSIARSSLKVLPNSSSLSSAISISFNKRSRFLRLHSALYTTTTSSESISRSSHLLELKE
ncbi:hypothetical protein HK096_011023, partial [Nowakowskiella sp. JEL0078]